MRTALALASAAAWCAALASAASVHAAILTNGGFDLPIAGAPNSIPANGQSPFYTLSVSSASLTGWTITKGTVDVIPDSHWQTQTGLANSYCIELVGTPLTAGDHSPQTGGISQTVDGLSVGDVYEFSYWYSVSPESDSYNDQNKNKILAVSVTDANSASLYHPANLVLTRGTRTGTNMQWKQVVADFTATTTTATVLIEAMLNDPAHPLNTSTNNVLTGPVIDSVTLKDITAGTRSVVPEPASLGLLGAAAILLARGRRALGRTAR